MNTEWLQTFRFVAELGSFTKAGERLFMSQPGVSAQIKQLEQSFGAELFARKGSRLQLTAAGEAVLQFAEHLEELLAATRASLAPAHDDLRPLTIGSSTTPATYILPMLIAEFRKSVPGAIINVSAMSLVETRARLLAGDIDFGVIAQRDFSEDLAVQPLVTTRLWVIAPASHPLATLSAVSPEQVTENPMLLLGPGMESNRLARLWAADHQVALRVTMEINSHDALKEAVKLGLGLAFAGGPGVLEEIREGKLAALAAPDTPIELPLYLAHRRDVHRALKAKFITCVRSTSWRLRVPAFV